MSWSLIRGALPIVNRIDQETEKEARAHKGCRAIQEEEEKKLYQLCHLYNKYRYEKQYVISLSYQQIFNCTVK
jgi:hypothetical protein